MMEYAIVDPVLKSWVQKNKLHLFTSFADRAARFFYVSDKQGQTAQISIDPPQENRLRVHIWSVETKSDEEFHVESEIDILDLAEELELALQRARLLLAKQSTGKA